MRTDLLRVVKSALSATLSLKIPPALIRLLSSNGNIMGFGIREKDGDVCVAVVNQHATVNRATGGMIHMAAQVFIRSIRQTYKMAMFSSTTRKDAAVDWILTHSITELFVRVAA